MKHRRSLDAVDAALDAARRDARAASVPPALRARILAAAAPDRRGRVVDLVLRAAAVAASVAAVLFVAPVPLAAAEFDASPLVELNARLAETVAAPLEPLGLDQASAEPVGGVSSAALGGAAVVLLAAGLWFARTERRR